MKRLIMMVPARKEKNLVISEQILFLKQMIKNPRALGAIAPSSERLSKLICKNVCQKNDGYVLEVGAGTGRFTHQLLKSGVPANRLIVVELEPELVTYLRIRFPGITILCGSATDLGVLLPRETIGHIQTVVSGIPLMNLSLSVRENIVKNCFSVMRDGGSLLQFTYGALSPLPSKKMQLIQKCVGRVLMNMPPATVWEYKKDQAFPKSMESVAGSMPILS